ncbi:hypothetical protein Ciccas_007619 [Cichlidogyrus casuarinus]|uniref:Cobalamin adenosyltransferase-like domain-containing protein n=1 Tax=Cichlidogyrus casuarinus TaxID=1844966 RepID=A0ABD2Q2Q8_9PLAT
MDELLPKLTRFILPGGGEAASHMHVCRSVCRRMERIILKASVTGDIQPEILIYINRLSDYLFTVARFLSKLNNEEEIQHRLFSGEGVGKGGGSGGSVRDAGGAFGKREAALENKFMHDLELQQIKNFKKYLEEEVEHHKHQIQRHKEAIERHENKIQKLRHKDD